MTSLHTASSAEAWPSLSSLAQIFPGTSEMAGRMRALDWSKTSLGPVEQWPQSLRTCISTSLDCAFPIILWWGPQLAVLYNDEYRAYLGPEKHPSALGQDGVQVWSEIWDTIAPMLAQVLERGEATRSRDLLLHIDRGYREEAYFSFSYSPIRGEGGRIEGVFCPVIETTQRVIGERRLRTLRDLAAGCKGASSEGVAYQAAAGVLGANPHDVPFALIYRVDEQRCEAVLEATAGIEAGTAAAPLRVSLEAPSGACWSLDRVARSGQPLMLADARERFLNLPTGAWDVPPHAVMV